MEDELQPYRKKRKVESSDKVVFIYSSEYQGILLQLQHPTV